MPRVERLSWTDVAIDEIDLPKAKLKVTLGLGSGLTRRAGDPPGRVFGVTDRGPNLFVSAAMHDYGLDHLARLKGIKDAKVMPRPAEGPEIAELRIEGAKVKLVARHKLRTRDHRINGLALPGTGMEDVFDLAGKPLQRDPLGADAEAIAVMPDGSFFVAEEYGPSLLKVSADGVVSERWVAAGREHELAHPDLKVRGFLPESMQRRRLNRGLEALCASADGAFLYAGMQSALEGEDEHFTPVWKLDAATGAVAGEWRYPFDAPQSFLRDSSRRKVGKKDLKICEFAWAGEDRLVVLERIAQSTRLYAIELAHIGKKRLLMSSDDHPEIGSDMEGIAILSPAELLMCSDNDFGIEGAATEFWRITLDEPL